jgi:hypothetical protein
MQLRQSVNIRCFLLASIGFLLDPTGAILTVSLETQIVQDLVHHVQVLAYYMRFE